MDKFTNFDKFLTEYNSRAITQLENTEEIQDYFINYLSEDMGEHGGDRASYELKSYESKKGYTETIEVDCKTICTYNKNGDIDSFYYEFIY